MKRLVFMWCVLLLMVGCKKDEGTAGETAQEAMGLYAKGFNAMANDISKNIVDRYFEAVPEAGPDPSKFSKHLLFPEQNSAHSKVQEAKQAFEAAKGAAPDSLKHLGPLADELVKTAEAVVATYGEVQKYFDAEDFKDDKGAKAKDLHAKMLDQAKKYHQAVSKIGEAFDVIENQQMEADVKKYEGDKDYSYWFRELMMESKKLLAAARRVEKADEYAAPFAAMEKAATGFGEFMKTKGDKLPPGFKPFADTFDRYFAAAKRFGREIREVKPNAQKVDQEMEAMISAYNSIVSIGNSLFEIEGQGLLK